MRATRLERVFDLATRIAADKGWHALSVGCWVIVATGRTNRRRIDAHRVMLRAAFPDDGHAMRRWLPQPTGSMAALSMWPDASPRSARPSRGQGPTGLGQGRAPNRP